MFLLSKQQSATMYALFNIPQYILTVSHGVVMLIKSGGVRYSAYQCYRYRGVPRYLLYMFYDFLEFGVLENWPCIFDHSSN